MALPGMVVTIRLNPRDCLSILDLAEKMGYRNPALSFAAGRIEVLPAPHQLRPASLRSAPRGSSVDWVSAPAEPPRLADASQET